MINSVDTNIQKVWDILDDVRDLLLDIEHQLTAMENTLDEYDANEGHAPRKRGKNV